MRVIFVVICHFRELRARGYKEQKRQFHLGRGSDQRDRTAGAVGLAEGLAPVEVNLAQ